MPAITITEALAEIKTVQKRLQKKAQTVLQHAFRADHLRDPFEADGGSQEVLRRELQGIGDLEQRIVDLRQAINKANITESITIGTKTRTIAEWIIWRREVLPNHKGFYDKLTLSLINARQIVAKKSLAMAAEQKEADVVVNVNEKELAATIEGIEQVLGTLDGQLSLKNATIVLEV